MVLNDFVQTTLPMKLMTSMFQNLFPAINIQKVYNYAKIFYLVKFVVVAKGGVTRATKLLQLAIKSDFNAC